MKKYVERFRRNDEETAAAAALELNNIDAAQEERVLEKDSAKKSAPPKICQGETGSKKPLPKNLSSDSSHKRKTSFKIDVNLSDIAFITPSFIYLPVLKSKQISCHYVTFPLEMDYFPWVAKLVFFAVTYVERKKKTFVLNR